MVDEHGEGSWSSIAKSFPGRIGKQCRERWHNQLRPDIRRDAWTDEEEALLVAAHARLGNKWADISKSIPGRTENSVKNHWNATLRRRLLPDARLPGETTCLRNYMRTLDLGDTVARRTGAPGKSGSSARRTSPKRRRGGSAAFPGSSCSEADSDSDQTQVRGGGRDGFEWHPSRPQRSVRRRLPGPGDAPQLEPPLWHKQQLPWPRQPHADAAGAEVLGCFQQPGPDGGAAPQALSPLFPGLMLSAAGIVTPASGGVLGALDPAIQRARSLPGGSPQRHGDCSRPGRLMHVDSVGLVDPGWTAALLDDAALDGCNGLDEVMTGITATPFMQQLLGSEVPGSPRKAVALQHAEQASEDGSSNLGHLYGQALPAHWLSPSAAAGLGTNAFSLYMTPGPLPLAAPPNRRQSVCSSGMAARSTSPSPCATESVHSPSDVLVPLPLLPELHDSSQPTAGSRYAAPHVPTLRSLPPKQRHSRASSEGSEDSSRTQVEVGRGPILDPDAYMSRLDLRQLPEAATYCGVGPPVPPESAAETQLATEVWHICEQARSACGSQLGDIIIAVRLGGNGSDDGPVAGQSGLVVAVAASSPAVAMRALQQIVQLAIKLG